MKVRPLVIDETVRGVLSGLTHYAEQHPLLLPEMIAMLNQPGVSPCNAPERHCFVPLGYRVAFTIEQHPGGWFRHASFSVASDNPKDLPSITAVNELLPLLGYAHQITDRGVTGELVVYLEKLPGGFKAVNILEPMEDHAKRN